MNIERITVDLTAVCRSELAVMAHDTWHLAASGRRAARENHRAAAYEKAAALRGMADVPTKYPSFTRLAHDGAQSICSELQRHMMGVA